MTASRTNRDQAQAVIAFAFGRRLNKTGACPGRSNEQLARAAASLAPKLPLVAEREVAEALPEGVKAVAVVEASAAGWRRGTPGIAIRASQILLPRGLRRVIVIAHPAHLGRAQANCRWAGFTVLAAPSLHVDYDKCSAQWWTRGPIRWWLREAPLRLAEGIIHNSARDRSR